MPLNFKEDDYWAMRAPGNDLVDLDEILERVKNTAILAEEQEEAQRAWEENLKLENEEQLPQPNPVKEEETTT